VSVSASRCEAVRVAGRYLSPLRRQPRVALAAITDVMAQ
jgi:hypothetical protein